MNAPFAPQRQTRDYQASDAAHHIHAFLDQKALNAEGPRVIVGENACTCGTARASATSMACPACGAPSSAMAVAT